MVRTNVLRLVVLLCPLASWAADQSLDIKPGLWDVASTIQVSGLPPIPNLDQMTPELRHQGRYRAGDRQSKQHTD